MHNVKVYETTLELAFSLENALNIRIKSLFFHFNRNVISNMNVRPYAIVFTDTHNVKYKYMMKDIVKCLGFIPIYKLPKEPPTEYSMINIANKVTPISSQSAISMCRSMDQESFRYESTIGLNAVDTKTIDTVKTILTEYAIPFNELDIGLQLYTSASYNILIPYCYRNITDNGYCIIMAPHDFTITKSLGRFTYYNHKDVTSPADYHLAIIARCEECKKNIVCDWESFVGTKCPYCGNMVKM